MRSNDVLDWNLTDRRTIPGCQRRNEPVQFAIERDLVQQVAAIGFIRGAEIMQIHSAQLRHCPVRDSRWDSPKHEIVHALLAPSAYDVEAFLQLRDEQRNVVGIMLQVAIHGDDKFAFGVIESGCQGWSLPKIPAKLNHDHAAIDIGYLLQQMECAIPAAIIDKHQFKALAVSFHDRLQA